MLLKILLRTKNRIIMKQSSLKKKVRPHLRLRQCVLYNRLCKRYLRLYLEAISFSTSCPYNDVTNFHRHRLKIHLHLRFNSPISLSNAIWTWFKKMGILIIESNTTDFKIIFDDIIRDDIL
jgi:hypothetical protein